jgi:hypothetical protein
MTDNDLGDSDGSGGDKPSSEQGQIAAAIQSLERQFQAGPTQYEREAHTWTIRTGKGVIIYALLTVAIAVAAIWSSISAQQSLNLTRDIANADQRPIIWLTNHTDAPHYYPAPATQITWNWEFTNYGKSPAVHIRFDTYMSIDNGPYIHTYGGDKDITDIGAPLPPGKVDFDTVISRPGISDAEFARLMAADKAISISGVIKYQDAGGRPYETAFCLAHLASGATMYRETSANCQNDIK